MKIKLGQYMIRDWQRDDVPSLAKHANNSLIAMHLRDGFHHPYGRADAEAFIELVDKQDPKVFFAIASQTEAIGGIGLGLGIDVHRFTAELGYWLAEPYWNRGIMTEAVKTIAQWGFDRLGLNRISATPYTTNPASARVLEKAGFEREGILRASVVKEGRILNQCLYARVREDIDC
ncbi:MAG: GNAT family protein [Myxococcota bacterium]|nr:GNAT family protein [Myxococcota bacterium]